MISEDDLLLVGIMRSVQWALDDVAYELARNDFGAARADELAGILENLAALVRQRAPAGTF